MWSWPSTFSSIFWNYGFFIYILISYLIASLFEIYLILLRNKLITIVNCNMNNTVHVFAHIPYFYIKGKRKPHCELVTILTPFFLSSSPFLLVSVSSPLVLTVFMLPCAQSSSQLSLTQGCCPSQKSVSSICFGWTLWDPCWCLSLSAELLKYLLSISSRLS